ncbi:TPA: DUF2345 domain-containing protein, partial [Klebsiella pneumoniae]
RLMISWIASTIFGVHYPLRNIRICQTVLRRRLQSTQGHLQLTAKNGITIACGGAYIQLTPEGEIKVHGPGLLSLKGQHNMEGPASQDFPLPELPSSVCKDCLKRAQEIAQGFVPREV